MPLVGYLGLTCCNSDGFISLHVSYLVDVEAFKKNRS
jgi:hypothetical protein